MNRKATHKLMIFIKIKKKNWGIIHYRLLEKKTFFVKDVFQMYSNFPQKIYGQQIKTRLKNYPINKQKSDSD